jgi:alanyl-tRNA synthetase
VRHTAGRFGQVIESSQVTDVLTAEERKFREQVSRGRRLLGRLYPSGRLTEEDYEFLRDTHGLPRELVTELLSEGSSAGSVPFAASRFSSRSRYQRMARGEANSPSSTGLWTDQGRSTTSRG